MSIIEVEKLRQETDKWLYWAGQSGLDTTRHKAGELFYHFHLLWFQWYTECVGNNLDQEMLAALFAPTR